jgi:hypothetical protein
VGEADAVEFVPAVGVAVVVDFFFECFFAGDTDAWGVGLADVSAARTSGTAANVAKARRAANARITYSIRVLSYIWQERKQSVATKFQNETGPRALANYCKLARNKLVASPRRVIFAG